MVVVSGETRKNAALWVFNRLYQLQLAKYNQALPVGNPMLLQDIAEQLQATLQKILDCHKRHWEPCRATIAEATLLASDEQSYKKLFVKY